MKASLAAVFAAATLAFSLFGCGSAPSQPQGIEHASTAVIQVDDVPEYSGEPYVEIDGNQPSFTDADSSVEPGTEEYGDLDDFGRCTETFALIGDETMPTEKRGDISGVHPTGWEQNFYDFVDNEALYNRCHLIGYQLTAENANEKNLITGTRYMNIEGMEPFESQVARYVKDTDNHVMYRVTPIFEGNDLVASGVHMEAESVEDNGAGICFNVYCYNVQPGVTIDYATGENEASGIESSSSSAEHEYILNVKSKKFHLPDCSGVEKMSPVNKQSFSGTRDELIAKGYDPCHLCNP